jgi:hypothetical protein
MMPQNGSESRVHIDSIDLSTKTTWIGPLRKQSRVVVVAVAVLDGISAKMSNLSQIVSPSFFLKGFQRVSSNIPKHATQKLLVGIEIVRKLIRMQKELDFSYS